MARRISAFVLGCLVFALACEAVLRFAPVPTATRIGRYIDPRITTYPPGQEFRTATGWALFNPQQHKANEYGFIPDRPFISKGAIALIGDSLVEQNMLPEEQRLAAQLERELGSTPVYSMGVAGSGLFDYLERVRFAFEELEAASVVIVIERADVSQSACETGAFVDACLDDAGAVVVRPRQAQGKLRRVLAQSALLQYVVGVLRFSPETLVARLIPKEAREVGANGAVAAQKRDQRSEAVARGFLDVLAAFGTERVTLLFDPEITRPGAADSYGNDGLRILHEFASARGIRVIHPRAALESGRKLTGLSLAVGPYDAHWNGFTNCMVAVEVSRRGSGSLDREEIQRCALRAFGRLR